MKHPLVVTLFFCFLFVYNSLLAQGPDIKFGKVSKEELEMKEYAPDPSAEAVVLYDYGVARIDYLANTGFRITFDRVCRIKVFNQSGFDWATEEIYLYDDNTYEESISGLKGYTYNLEDGKIVKDKLEKDNIFSSKHSEYYTLEKFTMPNVKEGTVFEFKYTVYSNRITDLQSWTFQKSIPVAWSEYKVKIPEYFNYLQLSQGYEPFFMNESTIESGGSFGSDLYQNNVYHWAAKDCPALKDESFISDASNFYQKIEFQLASVNWPNGEFEIILGTWDKINKRLLESAEFGNQVKSRGFYGDVLDQIISPEFSDVQKAAAIYEYVSNNVKWNNNYGYWPDNSIKKAFNDKTGDVAQINLMVVSMLDALGIESHPVLISTREHGLVNPIHPILDKYNYLIAEAIIDGKSILIDATERGLPLGMLPTRSLNQMGRRICREKPDWVSLTPVAGQELMNYFTIDLDEKGNLAGTLQMKKSGYTAFDTRSDIMKNGKDKYLEKLKKGKPDWEISNHAFENIDDTYKDLKESYEFEHNSGAMVAGAMIYLSPLMGEGQSENPFKKDIRKLPIDFVQPISEKNVIVISLPEGYQAEELPESVRLATSDRSCTFSFVVNKIGNKIQVSYDLNISKSFYGAESYKELKEFFDIIVSKSNEQVVLKKI